MPSDPAPDLDGDWDDGLSPERTELAWGRTGLAVVVAVGVLARRVWTLNGGVGIVALVVIAAGALVWLRGMRTSRSLEQTMEPHGMAGRRPFLLITAGTVLLATGGLIFGVLVTS